MSNEATEHCRFCRGSGSRMTMAGPRRCKCTPAPAKVRGPGASTHEGECGVCERWFSLGLNNERLALHGFARPGYGWLVGKCPGENRLPVERSKETIEILRAIVIRRAEDAGATLAELRAPGLQELVHEHRRPGSYNLPRTASYAERFEVVTIVRGSGADYQRGLPSFDDLLARRIRETEANAKHARECVQRADDRIAAWQPKDPRPR
jgi:hypothetical protein